MEQTDLLLPHRGLPPTEEECLGSATLLSTSLGSESLLLPYGSTLKDGMKGKFYNWLLLSQEN